jgi:hypothetical protein
VDCMFSKRQPNTSKESPHPPCLQGLGLELNGQAGTREHEISDHSQDGAAGYGRALIPLSGCMADTWEERGGTYESF